jgi:hypothetical protein
MLGQNPLLQKRRSSQGIGGSERWFADRYQRTKKETPVRAHSPMFLSPRGDPTAPAPALPSAAPNSAGSEGNVMPTLREGETTLQKNVNFSRGIAPFSEWTN